MPCGDSRSLLLVCGALEKRVAFESALGAIFGDLGWIFEVLGGPNRHKNRFPRACASMSFLHVLGHRFLVFFRTLRTLKVMLPSRRNAYFRIIAICKHISKKCRFGLPFRTKKQTKNYENESPKTYIFGTSYFNNIFSDFCDFGSILGWPGGSKNHQKFVKSVHGGVKSDPGGSLGPLRDMARTFGVI